MIAMITVLFFVALLCAPGFYIITRKVFPRGSKKSAGWLAMLLTAAMVVFFAFVMNGALG